MSQIEQLDIDIRDRDHSWFESVKVYLDRENDDYYFPLESVERLGEIDEDSENYFLIDSSIEAEVDEIDIDGRAVKVWRVGCTQLRVRPSRTS